MFRWISTKIFGGNQTEKGKKEESFEDAVEVLETEIGNHGDHEISENINNSAVIGDPTEDNRESVSKQENSTTKTDTSVWENVEISQTEMSGDVQNTSTWENVEMTLTSPTLVINEVKIDGKEQISDDKSDTNNRSNDTSVWENIEIANKNGTALFQEIEAEEETEINVDMLTSAIESDIKSESSDFKSKTDLMSTLSKRSINQEMKKFAAKSQNDQSKFNGSDNRETCPRQGVVSSGTHKNRKVQKDEADKDLPRTEDGVKTEKAETTETERTSKPQEEPEDILSLVTRLTAEGNLVRAKKLIYGLGHLKGIDNKEIDAHILKQYEIAVKKNSHGWIKDARYFAEVMYSRQWIDKNLPTIHQRNRNRDRDREQKRQEWRRKENEAPPQEERQSRFTGMCQDVRLLSNPDLPVVRSNAAVKQSENTDTNKANVNESNNSKQNTKNEEKDVIEIKEKLQNFNQMKSAIEDIISRRAEKGPPKMMKSEEVSDPQQRPQRQKVDEEVSGIFVKAVTDDDQIIQSVDVCMPTLPFSEGQEVTEIQSNDESQVIMKQDSNTADLQIKDCVVKLERLPGYYHVQSPKVKSPDGLNTSKSENKSSNDECKSPVGGAKTKGTPKRKLSGSSKKPWVNGDDGMEVEESGDGQNYVRWIGNDNGCKMTVSSDDLIIDDDCIISYGKPVNKPDIPSDPNSPDIQKFVKDILGKVCTDVTTTDDYRQVQNGDSANVQNMIDTDSATMDSGDRVDTVDQHLYQDQFVSFCQQSASTDGAGDISTSKEASSFQNEYLQFCQTK